MGKRTALIIVLIIIVALAIWAIVASQGQPQTAGEAPTSTTTASSTGSGSYGPGAAVMPSSTVATSTPPGTTAVQSAYFSTGSSTALGTYLTDPHGRTLYIFTKDTKDKSNCTGACLTIWPPYGPGIKATNAPVNMPMLPVGVSVIKGNNGMVQFTYNGMPLYYYSKDTAPGQTNGQGVLGTWFVVKLQ